MALVRRRRPEALIEELWWAHRIDSVRAARLVQHLLYGLQLGAGRGRVAAGARRASGPGGRRIVMAWNGQRQAHRLQPVQSAAACSTADLRQSGRVSRLSTRGSQAATQRPQPVQRSASMSGRRGAGRRRSSAVDLRLGALSKRRCEARSCAGALLEPSTPCHLDLADGRGRGPRRAHATSRSTASRGPATIASTEPSWRLRTQPARPSRRASCAMAQR